MDSKAPSIRFTSASDEDASRVAAVLGALGFRAVRLVETGHAEGWGLAELARRHSLTEWEFEYVHAWLRRLCTNRAAVRCYGEEQIIHKLGGRTPAEALASIVEVVEVEVPKVEHPVAMMLVVEHMLGVSDRRNEQLRLATRMKASTEPTEPGFYWRRTQDHFDPARGSCWRWTVVEVYRCYGDPEGPLMTNGYEVAGSGVEWGPRCHPPDVDGTLGQELARPSTEARQIPSFVVGATPPAEALSANDWTNLGNGSWYHSEDGTSVDTAGGTTSVTGSRELLSAELRAFADLADEPKWSALGGGGAR